MSPLSIHIVANVIRLVYQMQHATRFVRFVSILLIFAHRVLLTFESQGRSFARKLISRFIRLGHGFLGPQGREPARNEATKMHTPSRLPPFRITLDPVFVFYLRFYRHLPIPRCFLVTFKRPKRERFTPRFSRHNYVADQDFGCASIRRRIVINDGSWLKRA